MRILLVLLDKEWRQFLRNPFLPRMAAIFPLMVMLVFPWVTTMDVRHIDVGVVDHDRTPASQRLIRKIECSDYFTFRGEWPDYASALETLETGTTDVIVEIPDDFDQQLTLQAPPQIHLAANGVNAVSGSIGMQYLTQLVGQTLAELSAEQGVIAPPDPVCIEYRYNPTLEYRFYMIPALMIMLLIMLCGILPALNLVGEKETGTIEQINVTPVGRFTFTLAKLIPYWILGLLVLAVAMLLAWLIYGLTPVGSIASIYLAAGLFVLTMSGLGVFVANHSSTMQQTMFVMFFFIMIFVLMSGLITPVESMPQWAQWITRFLPPRYFVEIMRGVYLKGATPADLCGHYIALALFAALTNTLAAVTYRKQS